MMMIDLTEKNQHEDETKFKSFMGKTPQILKTKLLTVLGNSNEILNEFSNKLDMALGLSSSSDSESSQFKNINCCNDEDSSKIDEHGEDAFDYELRRVKERRAHEEVLSGKYQHPNYTTDDLDEQTSNSDAISDSSPEEILRSNDSGKTQNESSLSQISKEGTFSEFTSGNISLISNITLDSSDLLFFPRSESSCSVPSWSSSVSIENQIDDDAFDFMKKFIKILFDDCKMITVELKSEFGQHTMTEFGRLWFSRLINIQRIKHKRVSEITFYALVQYFAIVLFECGEADDFSTAKNLMNMCFTFFHEVDVPGCKPYREYLYNYLRDQPIWLSLRFWNAAFFDALHCERGNRPIPKINSNLTNASDDKSSTSSKCMKTNDERINLNLEIQEDQEFQQNITFGQLGTFTCNMHAFGLSKDLCIEFLRKQSVIANLNKEQEVMLRENINRMYKETDKWRV